MASEEQLNSWGSKTSSDTEKAKQDAAVRMIGEAIKEYEPLAGRDVKVIRQGSFRNNTNTATKSDVDVCVCCTSTIFSEDWDALDYTKEDARLGPTDYSFVQFRSDVEAALEQKFGAVDELGDKSLKLRKNTYRVDADVVPALEFRQYKPSSEKTGSLSENYLKPAGTKFLSRKDKTSVVNWPEQHYANGVIKNKDTSYRFKHMVRVMKALRDNMGMNSSEAPSFLIESLAYNIDPLLFQQVDADALKSILSFSYGEANSNSPKWVEVNGIKQLFGAGQLWTPKTALDLVIAMWKEMKFS